MQIKNFKTIDKGALAAKFDLYFENMGMSVRDCAYMKSGSKEWINMPSRKYQDETGATKFYAFVTFSQEKREAFQKKCMELLKPLMENRQPYIEDNEELPF